MNVVNQFAQMRRLMELFGLFVFGAVGCESVNYVVSYITSLKLCYSSYSRSNIILSRAPCDCFSCKLFQGNLLSYNHPYALESYCSILLEKWYYFRRLRRTLGKTEGLSTLCSRSRTAQIPDFWNAIAIAPSRTLANADSPSQSLLCETSLRAGCRIERHDYPSAIARTALPNCLGSRIRQVLLGR